jgi:hypothetical protein
MGKAAEAPLRLCPRGAGPCSGAAAERPAKGGQTRSFLRCLDQIKRLGRGLPVPWTHNFQYVLNRRWA